MSDDKKIQEFCYKLENCGKRLQPLYNKLFNEFLLVGNAGNNYSSDEKIESRKRLFKSFISSQQKLLNIFYSHMIKQHELNKEKIVLMEKIQTYENQLVNLAKERNGLVIEINELHTESRIVNNNLAEVNSQYSKSRIIRANQVAVSNSSEFMGRDS